MKRGILLVGFVLLLSACKQEPMIHISPDVQASIDKKAADRQGTTNNSTAETSASMTEISGEVVEILVENGQMVDYGQELFAIKKN